MKFIALLLSIFVLACSTTPPPAPPPRAEVAAFLKSVTVELRNVELGALCSGVWIGKHTVLTAAHCTEDVDHLSVYRPDENVAHEGVVLKKLEDLDLSVLAVAEDLDHPVASMGGLPAVGDTVLTMGHPVGLLYSFSVGQVAAIRDMKDKELDGEAPCVVIQATAPISPGNSGGGLFNERGELVGIASFQMRRGQNLNFWIFVGQSH